MLNTQRSHYVSHVLRLRPGAELICFDGTGQEFNAILQTSKGKLASLVVGKLTRTPAQPSPALHLAVGWLKGQAMDTVMQKATELGASDLWPVTATRSNVKISPQRTASRLEHWQKIATHAAEQSARLFVPTVHEPVSLTGYLGAHPDLTKVLLHPGYPPLKANLAYAPLALLVGPEGGWTDEEIATATSAGATPHGLGERILRAETAPLAALACIHQLWGWR